MLLDDAALSAAVSSCGVVGGHFYTADKCDGEEDCYLGHDERICTGKLRLCNIVIVS